MTPPFSLPGHMPLLFVYSMGIGFLAACMKVPLDSP